jgi:hypothetical protein
MTGATNAPRRELRVRHAADDVIDNSSDTWRDGVGRFGGHAQNDTAATPTDYEEPRKGHLVTKVQSED